MEPVALPRNIIVINDTYNANPQSMEVALRSLAELKGSSRGLAVLGDMGELGATARDAHREAGRLAAELGIDFVFALGQHAGEVVAGAIAGGLARERAIAGSDHDDLANRVRAVLRGSDWVLVKGSRSMKMERVVQALSQNGSAAEAPH
jgi:UDP-N-acetylmuramoyl-tripeptide--D-alanyl-D-alanine ligase